MVASYPGANESVLRSRSSINVKDYGALGDGTPEPATPFQDAYNDARVLGRDVFIPAGTYYVSDVTSESVFKLACDGNGLTTAAVAPKLGIRFEDGAEIKLSESTLCFVNFVKQADHDWFRNFAFYGVNIDANQVAGSYHIFYGVWQGSAVPANGAGTRVNFENLSAYRTRIRNVKTDDSASLTNNRMGVWLATTQPASGEGTQNVIRNILFEDYVCGDGVTGGGNGGISIQGGAATGETPNILIDNIVLNRYRHDRGFSPQVYCGMNSFHVGSEAQVRNVTARDGWSRGAGDTGLEINNAQSGYVDGFTAVDPYGIGWSTTNFRAVEYVEGQLVHFNEARLRRTTDGPSGATPKPFVLGPPRPAVPIGTVKNSNCTAHFAEAPGFNASGYFLNAEDEQQVQHLILEDCKCHIENVTGAIPDATTWTPMFVWAEIIGKLTIRGLDLKAAGGVTLGAGAQLRCNAIDVRGGSLELDAEGIDLSYDVTNTYRFQAINVYGTSAVQGRVRRLRASSIAGYLEAAYALGTSGSGQIAALKFEDCDLSEFDAMTALTTAADIAKLAFLHCDLPVIPTVASAATVSFPAAPFVIMTGNAGVTTITAHPYGTVVMVKFTGTPVLTDGGNLKLAGNLTPNADDVIAFVCDGTDWYQAAPGSAN